MAATLLATLLCFLLSACSSGVPVISTIEVASSQSSVPVSGMDSFTATAKDRNGKVVAGTVFTFSSSNTSAASITSGGLASGLLPGTTSITASAGGVTSNGLTLTVTPGFILTGSLNTARYGATATLLANGMVLVAGGAGTAAIGGGLTSAELYDPATGTFTPTGSLSTPRFNNTATLLNDGRVLVVGGVVDSSGNEEPVASAELFDPATGTFSPTGSLNNARSNHTATLLNGGKVLVASGDATGTAELYDPVAGTFTLTGSVNTARQVAAAVLLNDGKVLLAGGLCVDLGPFAGPSTCPASYLASAELYDPATGEFTFTGSMTNSRDLFTATLLANGTVLVAGGVSNAVPTSTAELFDPSTATFTPTGSLSAVRFLHTASLLQNGLVLIAGGVTSTSGGAPTSDELFDPASGAFALTGSLNTERFGQATALLANGQVLIAGGVSDSGGGLLSSAELYEPGP
jgi:Galactose oxidase, central domain